MTWKEVELYLVDHSLFVHVIYYELWQFQFVWKIRAKRDIWGYDPSHRSPKPLNRGNQLHKNMVKCFAFWIKYRNLNWRVSLNTATARWQYCSLYSVFHLWKEAACRDFSLLFPVPEEAGERPLLPRRGMAALLWGAAALPELLLGSFSLEREF